MLVACRLAGLSALEVRARAQCGADPSKGHARSGESYSDVILRVTKARTGS
jgi:hypothetical protein